MTKQINHDEPPSDSVGHSENILDWRLPNGKKVRDCTGYQVCEQLERLQTAYLNGGGLSND